MSRFIQLCDEYRENRRLIEELTAMNDGIKSDILAIMGDDDTYIEGAAKCTNKLIVSNRFDSGAFRKIYPALYDEFNKQSSYRRFIVI